MDNIYYFWSINQHNFYNYNKKGDKISKAIIAQILADEIENRYCKEKEEFKSKLEQDSYVKYLIEAIKFLGE